MKKTKPRIIFDTTDRFKQMVLRRAKQLGFSGYKDYIVHLIANDIQKKEEASD